MTIKPDNTAARGRVVRALGPALLTLLVSACASVGPAYQAPEPHPPAAWAHGADAGAPAPLDATQLTQWWKNLDDPTLSELIESALLANPDLGSARARLREARARRDLAGADRFPTLGVSAAANRTSSNQSGSDSATRYSAGFDASWEPDLFGTQRRTLAAASAEVSASVADIHAAQVSLSAEVALNYVELRSLQQRLSIARNNLTSQGDTLQITDWRTQAGLASSLDVEQARTTREQTRAQIPTLETSLAEAEHRLAILLGKPPGALHERLAEPAPVPAAATAIAVGIPADTLRQRPDIRAAERRLAAQTERVGAAEAARYPNASLSGSIGLEALSLSALGASGAITRSLLASVGATLFDGGRLKRQVDIQDAQREQIQIAYEQAVLTALEDVENALVAFGNARLRREALGEATDSARNAAMLAQHRYAAGLTDFQSVLDTSRTVLSVEDSLASAQAQQTTALIQLYKALGGGWQNEADPHSGDTSAIGSKLAFGTP